MPYIGTQPTTGVFTELDALTASATADYALTLNGAAYNPATVNNLLVSINGVIQAGSTMSLSGNTLTVGATLSSSDVIDFVRVFGSVGTVSTPTDGSVTTAKIGNGAVTAAKISSLPAGSVLQVQSSVSTAASTITGTSYADIPSMTATITPSSTSSKILVQVSFGAMGSSGTSHGCLMKLFRGSTEIGQGASADTHNVFMQNYLPATNSYWAISHMFVDSPSSTSALVYKMQWAMTGTGETFYINRRGIDNYARLSSTFLLTEIAG